MPLSPAAKIAIAFDLFDVGVEMRRERFRRENPEASDVEAEECVRAWLLDRPGARDGDAIGRTVSLPRPE